MRPVKLTVAGAFWDSYIYAGRLYLFAQDGSIESISWTEAVHDWSVPQDLRVSFLCAFLRSDYLYSSDVQELLHDREIRTVMQKKFSQLSDHEFDLSKKRRKKHQKGRQDNPCPFPHSDLEIYNQKLYVSSSKGVVSASCNKKTLYPIGTRSAVRWDGPALGLSASYGALAIASGSEGLFEIDCESIGTADPRLLSTQPCRDCSHAYFSVYASSDESGYLAEFSLHEDSTGYLWGRDRSLANIRPADSIFGTGGYSWGVQDKLCQVRDRSIKVVRYSPWSRDDSAILDSIGEVTFAEWKGNIISASTASFGVIVELEHALVVIPSSGDPVTIPGEPVNWRVFPRSRHYENQLHVVYEDHLEIYSFNHDYLVDQKQKVIGTTFSAKTRPGVRAARLFL